jgi:CRISPR-associated endoribonuclease Cas6
MKTMPVYDLTAVVLKLRAIQSIEIREHMGRASQEFALRMVGRCDPALAAALHPDQGGHDLKPFTTSGLLWEGTTTPVYGQVRHNEQVWLRLTALTRQVSVCLDHLVNNPPTKKEYEEPYKQSLIQLDDTAWRNIPDHVRVCMYDHRLWQLEAVYSESAQHAWAGRLNYAELAKQVEHPQRNHQLMLRFVSPTTFHSKGLDVPLPIPTLIFRSLIERWNAFAPLALAPHLLTFVEQYVAVTKYQTKTVMLTGKPGSGHIGFVGDVMFTIKTDNPGLRKHDADLASVLKKDHEHFSNLISVLARSAFFSGVGRQTTTGMGMCTAPTQAEE